MSAVQTLHSCVLQVRFHMNLSFVAVSLIFGVAFDVNVISTGVVYILCNSL